jgi:hypothetical protein
VVTDARQHGEIILTAREYAVDGLVCGMISGRARRRFCGEYLGVCERGAEVSFGEGRCAR